MIHLFNRAQLITALNLQKREAVCAALAQNGIDYRVKVVNQTRPTPFGGSREHTGTLFMDMDHLWQYTIYVKKSDLDYAQHCIRSANT